ESNERERLLVPRPLVEADGAGGARVWVADQAAGVARLRAVQLGAAHGDLVEVTEGLRVTDKLIATGRDGLSDGARVTVTGEDAARRVGPGGAPSGAKLKRRPDANAGHKGKH